MNNQIQKFAEQAGMYVDLKGKPWPKWMSAEECEVAYAKFAELIVRECAQICRDQPNYYALKKDRDNCAVAIEEHFGVEE
jgi:hypothetical protein